MTLGPRSILGRTRSSRNRRLIGVSLALSVTLIACSGGTPSKSDFTDKLRNGIGADLDTALQAQGVEQSVVADAINEYVDCQYESIKDQPTLLQAVYDDPTAATVSAQLETLTEPCSAALSTTLSENVTATTTPSTTMPPATTPTTLLPPSKPLTIPTTTTG